MGYAHVATAQMLAMKPVGKPDAGNPHVRFDERGGETGRASDTAPFLDSTSLCCVFVIEVASARTVEEHRFMTEPKPTRQVAFGRCLHFDAGLPAQSLQQLTRRTPASLHSRRLRAFRSTSGVLCVVPASACSVGLDLVL
jgi:hypothetical protein